MNRLKELIQKAEEDAKAKGPTRAELVLATPNTTLPPARGRVITRNELGQNKTEAAYAVHLESRKSSGEILAWWWDVLTLKLGQDCRYKTDFMVQLPDGELQIHETKGFMREDAQVKLKVCRANFPFPVFLVKRGNKSEPWVITEFRPW